MWHTILIFLVFFISILKINKGKYILFDITELCIIELFQVKIRKNSSLTEIVHCIGKIRSIRIQNNRVRICICLLRCVDKFINIITSKSVGNHLLLTLTV